MTGRKEKIGIIYHPDYLKHTQGHHPERKERLEHIIKALQRDEYNKLLTFYQPEAATVDDLAMVHDRDYIRSVEEACRSGRRSLDMDTYLVQESYDVALKAAGGALTALHNVMGKKERIAFALVRPPGHHAEVDQARGFCLFNNIAIAAAAAKRDYQLERIAIVDWDVHHGNGTQQAFERDSEVLFISVHQSPAFPGSGNVSEIGLGAGKGYTINIPLAPGCGDVEYALIFDQLIIPVLDQFKPELLLISAGQDAYRYDPLAGMDLTHQAYYRMADQLAAVADRWAEGRVLLCLEGGYDLEGQAESVVQVLNGLGRWGMPVGERAPSLEPLTAVSNRLAEVKAIQGRYWHFK